MAFKLNFKLFLIVFLVVAIQVLFLRDLSLGSYAFCFIYLWPIVKAPLEMKPIPLLLIAFCLGWIIDIFYNTHGMHAVASLTTAYLRTYYINILTPANGYDERSKISLREMSWLWFLPYVFLILITHHLIFFLLEASDYTLILMSILKALASSLLTLFVFVLLEMFDKKESL
ncbi:rod shape-determining protein MreD [Aquirufa sp. ROCK-SH2]